jgi:hypothetical protein
VAESKGVTRREAGSEGNAKQKHEPMDKNRIGGAGRGASWPMTAKSISIKIARRKSGSCVRKAIVLTSGRGPPQIPAKPQK